MKNRGPFGGKTLICIMPVSLGAFFDFRPKGYNSDLGADFSLSP